MYAYTYAYIHVCAYIRHRALAARSGMLMQEMALCALLTAICSVDLCPFCVDLKRDDPKISYVFFHETAPFSSCYNHL